MGSVDGARVAKRACRDCVCVLCMSTWERHMPIVLCWVAMDRGILPRNQPVTSALYV